MNKKNLLRKEEKLKIFAKILFSVFFIVAVSFLVIKNCIHKAPPRIEGRVEERLKPVPPPLAVQKKAKMAIILDDWGNNYLSLKAALDIDRPITLAVLPNLRYSQRIAQEAKNHHLGVMLHMPMQPKSKHQPLEPETILITSSDADIIQYLNRALKSVGCAEGMNNHMGSLAVTNARVMRTLLSQLKKNGLFFVDSNTTKETLGPKIARELAIPYAKRDVFLDTQMKEESIKKQMIFAKKMALRYGRVVVIGHDRKITLEVIKQMVPELEREGIEFVLVRDMLITSKA